MTKFNITSEELSSSRNRIQELEAQLSQVVRSDLIDHMQIDSSNEKVSLLEKQNENLKQRLQEATTEQSQLEKLIEKQQTRIYELTEQIKKLETDSSTADLLLQERERVQEVTSRLNSLQEKINE